MLILSNLKNQKMKNFLLGCVLLSITLLPISSLKSQVFTTDVIVQGSQCIGIDCTTSESYGFDTQRFKENNLRIHFDDSSNTASFPGNDWRFLFNDTGDGGENYFAVEDATAANIPFRVKAGAGADALVVDSDGDVGLGTATPFVELHLSDGDSPTLRLEQSGASGFTAQTWDIAGNESNFFIRDVTNGSKLPFKIKPGASTNSIFVNSNGNVTLGADQNDEKLLVKGNVALDGTVNLLQGSADVFRLSSNDGNAFSIQRADSTNMIVIDDNAPENSLFVHESGFVSIGSNIENDKLYIDGGLTVNGDVNVLSDQRLKTNIEDIGYGLKEVMLLAAKKYDFKSSGEFELNLPSSTQLGLIAQEVEQLIPEVVTNDIKAMKDEGEINLKGVNYSALIPVLIKAIQEQQLIIESKTAEIADIHRSLAVMNANMDLLTKKLKSYKLVQSSNDIDDSDRSANQQPATSKPSLQQKVLNNGRKPNNH